MNSTVYGDNSSIQFNDFPEKSGAIVLIIRSHEEAPFSFSTVLSIATLLIVLGIIVNGAICFVMLRRKRYKKNTSNFFILHLSVTELALRLLIFPIAVYPLVTTIEIKSIQCKFLTLVSKTFASATFISLVAIATDRYQNIVYPMKALKSKRKPVYLVLLVWLYAAAISSPSVVSVRIISINEIPEAQGMNCDNCANRKICDIPQNALGQASTTSYFLSAFFLPLVVIFVLYAKIALILHQRSNNGMMHKMAARSRSKAIRMLVLTVFGYVLSLLPSALHAMLRSYGKLNNISFPNMFAVTWIVETVTLTCSLVNPIIYAYYNGEFRKELVKPFRCRKITKALSISRGSSR